MELNVSEILIDFLNVAIHQILFLRDIYPEEVFAAAKQYGVPVKMSRHPELNQYIAESLTLAQNWISKGEAKKIVVHIEDRDDKPLERFVFELEVLQNNIINTPLREIEKQFSDFLLRISITNLQPNPKDCKFSIVTYTTANELDPQWIFAEQQEIKHPPPTIKPLKSLQDNSFILQLFVEENIPLKHSIIALTQK